MNSRRSLLSGAFCALLSLGAACAAETPKLKVALFPYIPDAAGDEYKSLLQNLEHRFEKENPRINLELTLTPYDPAFYEEPMKMAGWLASGEFDLVQTDTVLLGDLRAAGVIEAWDDRAAKDFFPAAVAGSMLKTSDKTEQWFGVPHFMCGYFLISESEALNKATTFSQFLLAAKAAGKPVVGNLDGSWELPAIYLDARVDLGAVTDKLDVKVPLKQGAEVATNLAALSDLCGPHGANPCVDGTFADKPDRAADQFAKGEAAAIWGYSERLHRVVSEMKKAHKPTTQLLVTALPLGVMNQPLLFTDTFVKRKGCKASAKCQSAADIFVRFINSEWAISQVFLSLDAAKGGEPATPRYLLPAARAAYDIQALAKDPLYAQLKHWAEIGQTMPNDIDMIERRRAAKAELDKSLF